MEASKIVLGRLVGVDLAIYQKKIQDQEHTISLIHNRLKTYTDLKLWNQVGLFLEALKMLFLQQLIKTKIQVLELMTQFSQRVELLKGFLEALLPTRNS